MRHLGGWGVMASWAVTEVEGPRLGCSMEVIWMTALSSEPTGRYRRPLGGAGTGRPSSAASISAFSIPGRAAAARTKKGESVLRDLDPRPSAGRKGRLGSTQRGGDRWKAYPGPTESGGTALRRRNGRRRRGGDGRREGGSWKSFAMKRNWYVCCLVPRFCAEHPGKVAPDELRTRLQGLLLHEAVDFLTFEEKKNVSNA